MSCALKAALRLSLRFVLMILWYSDVYPFKQVLHGTVAEDCHAGFDFFKGFLAVFDDELRFFFEF